MVKTRARSASTEEEYLFCGASFFVHCFRVYGYPGETLAQVVYMASQMNRDVTGCLGMLI